jgi:hypothetical protein
MTHQYVGAYYVPHGWYMEYDPQFQYDPLSTVFYKNAWYILKQPAPVGTEPTNSQYWAQYSMVPGQIAQLEEEIAELKEQLSTISKDINKPLNECKYVLIGDSFGAGWQPMLINAIKMPRENVYSSYVGGDDFGKGYMEQLNKLISQISDPLSIDKVIFIGGTNGTDVNMNNSYTESIEACLTAAKNAFPQATVYCGYVATLFRESDYNIINNTSRNRMKTYGKYCYQNACYGTNCVFIDGLTESLADIRSYITEDLIHPQQIGYIVMTESILNVLNNSALTQYYTPSPKQSFTFTEAGWTVAGTFEKSAGVKKITFQTITYSGDSISIPANQAIQIVPSALFNFYPIFSTTKPIINRINDQYRHLYLNFNRPGLKIYNMESTPATFTSFTLFGGVSFEFTNP